MSKKEHMSTESLSKLGVTQHGRHFNNGVVLEGWHEGTLYRDGIAVIERQDAHYDLFARDSPYNPENNKPKNKYQKVIKNIYGADLGLVDVYSVLSAFGVVEPGLQHAIKKLLMPGLRGKGDFTQDLKEAIQAIERTIICHNKIITK